MEEGLSLAPVMAPPNDLLELGELSSLIINITAHIRVCKCTCIFEMWRVQKCLIVLS